MSRRRSFTVAPSAARLTESLRDIGYDFPSAVADLVDNSIAAQACHIDVLIDIEPTEPRIFIADDGRGMSANTVNEALRFGSRRAYGDHDLGRYGLGLKTASLSQGRRITIVSRRPPSGPVTVRQLDLDLISRFDEWLIVHPGETGTVSLARTLLAEEMNTVIVWEILDRLLPGRRDTGHARRRLETIRQRTIEHLAMVFHRYLDGSARQHVTITVNGEKIEAWDPFARCEPATVQLSDQNFEISAGDSQGRVGLRRWILPARHSFSGANGFDHFAGPLKWNRQQGLYIYRADRLVQWGGWAGMRAIDEHTKLARCALDFSTDLDAAFNINVAKMRVALPPSLRPMLERPVQELCQAAEASYRNLLQPDHSDARTWKGQELPVSSQTSDPQPGLSRRVIHEEAGLALLSAAVQADRFEALRDISAVLRIQAPGIAANLGLDDL